MTNEKGQAALADSLFFLLIVSGLTTFLFFFVSIYGQSIDQQLLREYRQEYASSALKTIMYSSAPRISGENLDTAIQVDYFLASLKEDYAADETFDESQAALKEMVSRTMFPFKQASDYIFYIYFPENEASKFGYFLIAVTTREYAGDRAIAIAHGSVQKLFYKCAPADLKSVEKNILTKVGDLAQATARSKFIVTSGDGTEKSSPTAQITLVMWVPAEIGTGWETGLACTEIP